MKNNLSQKDINVSYNKIFMKNDKMVRANSTIFNRKIMSFFPKRINQSFKNINIKNIRKIIGSKKNETKIYCKSDNNLKENNNSFTNEKIKDKFIEKMRNNFSNDKNKRKKTLYVNVHVNLNQNYSMLNNNNLDNSELNKNKENTFLIDNKRNHDKENPMRLFTDPNLLLKKKNTLGSYNDKLIKIECNKETKLPKMITNKTINENENKNNFFQELEIKLEKLLKDINVSSKSRKYNIIKIIFEEGIESIKNIYEKNFLKLITSKYHKLFSEIFKENQSLKQNYETLKNQYLMTDKNYIETISKLKEKEKEIEKMKNDVVLLNTEKKKVKIARNNDKFNFNNLEMVFSKSVDNILVNHHNKYLDRINKINIEDLDALYFKDKINQDKTQNSKKNKEKVPKLDFGPVNDFLEQSKISNNYKCHQFKKSLNIINNFYKKNK